MGGDTMTETPDRRTEHSAHEVDRIEHLVRTVLRWGLVVSTALLLGGMVTWTVRGGALPDSVVGPVDAVRGASRLQPQALFSLGLLALILTPFVRVAGTVVVFLKERDWRYTAVTALVFASMVAGLVLGAL